MSCEIQSRLGSVLVQESNRVDDDVSNICIGCILRDGWTEESSHRRINCWSGIEKKLPEISREVN